MDTYAHMMLVWCFIRVICFGLRIQMRVFAVRVSLSFGNGCYGIGGHDKYPWLHFVRSWICTWRQPTTRTKYMVNVRSSISHCQMPFRHPFQVYGKRPIPVTWICYGRRHVSVVRDRWCSQHSTHISVEYCDKYRIMSVVYDGLHLMTISYPIVMVQTLLWVMVEWSDVNVV